MVWFFYLLILVCKLTHGFALLFFCSIVLHFFDTNKTVVYSFQLFILFIVEYEIHRTNAYPMKHQSINKIEHCFPTFFICNAIFFSYHILVPSHGVYAWLCFLGISFVFFLMVVQHHTDNAAVRAANK